MNLGDESAFPVPDSDNLLAESGMTYRQWLFGMVLNGTIAEGRGSSWPGMIEAALRHTDEAIATLERNKHDRKD